MENWSSAVSGEDTFSSPSFLPGSKGTELTNFFAAKGGISGGGVEVAGVGVQSAGGSVAEATETKDDEEFESRDDFGRAKLRNDGIWDGR